MYPAPSAKSIRAGGLLVISFALVVFCSNTFGQNPQDVRQYVVKARSAYREKNYAGLIDNMKLALTSRPNYALYIYNLAVGYALNGNTQEALNWLNRLADMGLVYSPANDKDFTSISNTSEFKAIVDHFTLNAKPVGHSVTAFTVHEKGLVPEGLAYDPITKTFYLGSVYKRKIISINDAGEVKDFSSALDGLWSVMGMRVDPKKRLLWVCTAAHAQMMNFDAKDKQVSGLFKYDLVTGKLLKKYLLPTQPAGHWLGDLVLNSRGEPFASDSITPAIYFVNKRTDQLEMFLENSAFVNPQGLAFSGDEKRLFMADYLKGIFSIDMKTKAVSLLKPATATTMLGFDGLYYYKGKLVGMQNGVNPPRLVELSLNPGQTEVRRLNVLEANNPSFDEPTLAVLQHDTIFYIANSQWGAIDENGKLAPEDKLKDPIILKLRL